MLWIGSSSWEFNWNRMMRLEWWGLEFHFMTSENLFEIIYLGFMLLQQSALFLCIHSLLVLICSFCITIRTQAAYFDFWGEVYFIWLRTSVAVVLMTQSSHGLIIHNSNNYRAQNLESYCLTRDMLIFHRYTVHCLSPLCLHAIICYLAPVQLMGHH